MNAIWCFPWVLCELHSQAFPTFQWLSYFYAEEEIWLSEILWRTKIWLLSLTKKGSKVYRTTISCVCLHAHQRPDGAHWAHTAVSISADPSSQEWLLVTVEEHWRMTKSWKGSHTQVVQCGRNLGGGGDRKASEDFLRKDLIATKEKAVEYFKCSHWDRPRVVLLVDCLPSVPRGLPFALQHKIRLGMVSQPAVPALQRW